VKGAFEAICQNCLEEEIAEINLKSREVSRETGQASLQKSI